MDTLLLIDGSSYLYRAFYALPDLRSTDGLPTGTLYGILNMLRRVQKEMPFCYSACIFDPKGPTFRHTLYPEYKAHRPAMPDDLAQQIPIVHQAITALGWPLLVVPGVEADDVIGTLATMAVAQGMRVMVSSGDKDMTQLVNEQITMVNTLNGDYLDRDGVIKKFGIGPELIVDYLSLIGDKVDNVPGVHQCGPKTALKWLATYGSLEGVMQHAAEIKGVVGQQLQQALSHLPLARQLITIKCDVDLAPYLPQGLASLQLRPRQEAKLIELFDRYGFKTWLKELQNHPVSPPSQSIERRYSTLLTEAELGTWLDKINHAPVTSFDTETTSLDPLAARLVGISLSVEAGVAAYLPLTHRSHDSASQLDWALSLARLKPWLEDESKKKLGQNLKYDRHVLANHGIGLSGVLDDTLLASYVLESHLSHNLDDLAKRHLGESTLRYEDICGRGAKQIGFDEVDLETATRYAAEDADLTFRLNLVLKAQLDTNQTMIYRTIELAVAEVLFNMERHGVLIDPQRLATLSQQFAQRMLILQQQAQELAGQRFNLNSPKQLQTLLFQTLGIDTTGVRKTPTGAYSTDEAVLEKLALDHPLAKCILEYRTLAKLKSTYTDKLPQLVNARTGRVHTTYSQAVAVTGRLASSEPNLQNIPIRSADGRRVREAFIAPTGHVIVSADYSQIELRIMAHLSGDNGLLEAFAAGEDIHRATAAEIFSVDRTAVTHEQRRYAKSINFGLIYGMSAFGLAKQLGIERQAAQQFIDRYFMRYPNVSQYMQQTREQARQHGYVSTVLGRRLYLPDIRSSNMNKRHAAERAAINAPMQGSAADFIKLAMIAVEQWLQTQRLASRLIMQVHDELVLEVPENECQTICDSLPRLMASVAQLKVSLVAEVGVGPNWEAAH